MRRYHLQLDDGEAGAYALLPGDPGRCELIARHLDGAEQLRSNREFTTYAGQLDGARVCVVSTGIGGPSTAICVEELVSLGVGTMIRVGTCGAMQERVRPGDVVVVQGAVRDEGTSHLYVPAAFPAMASLDVVNALRDAAVAAGRGHHAGAVVSTDSFFGQRDMDGMPVAAELRARWQAWLGAGCLAVEMECAALLTVASVRDIHAGAVLAVVDRSGPGAEPMPDAHGLPLEPAIEVAVGALARLIAAAHAR
jgi:uridine phosphorylase